MTAKQRPFIKHDNGDRSIDDPRTKLRYVITVEAGVLVAYIHDISNHERPVRMATVPLRPGVLPSEAERVVRAHANSIAKRYANEVKKQSA